MTEQKVREHRKRRYEDGRPYERQCRHQSEIVLREVHPDCYQDDEVRREYREQQKPGQERRPWRRVLHGAEPPRRFARRAGQVAPDGQDNEQPDQQVLDDVAQRSGIRGIAERDAAAQHTGEAEGNRDAHTHGDHHARQEVGRELDRLGGGDEDEGRHDLGPRVHRDGEGQDGQAHTFGPFGTRSSRALEWAPSGKASTLSSSSPRLFMRSRMPKSCGWSMIVPVRTVTPSFASISIPSKATAYLSPSSLRTTMR